MAADVSAGKTPDSPSAPHAGSSSDTASATDARVASDIRLAKAHLRNSPLGVIEFGTDFSVTFWSDRAEQIFGYTAAEILGRRIEELLWVYEPDIPLVDEESRRMFTGERSRSMNVNRNYRKDGSVIWCEWYSSAIHDPDGNLVSVLSQVLDITERKRLEGELRIAEAKARDLIRNAPTPIFTIDLQTLRFTEINDAMREVTGYTHEELMQIQHPIDLVDEDSWRRARSVLEAPHIEEAFGKEMEVCLRRKDGRKVMIVVMARFSHDDDGAQSAFVIARDVTERRLAEQALRDSEAKLAAALDAERVARAEANDELATSRVLLAAAEAMAASVDSQELFATIAGVLMRETGLRVSISSWHDRPGELHVVASAGESAFPVGGIISVDKMNATTRTAIEEQRTMLNDFDALPAAERGVYEAYDAHLGLQVPIIYRKQLIGLIGLDEVGARREFTERDIALIEGVAAQAAVALEHARLFETQRGIAETLQETLVVLPAHVPGIMFSRSYLSATYEGGRVGGDFVDVFEVHGDVIGITLGDVSGKGVDAAVTTSLIRTTLRVHALDDLSPREVAHRANLMMHRFTEIESFVTLWFGLLNAATGQLRFVCAGHPPALVMSRDGTVRELAYGDPVIGAFEGMGYTEHEVWLEPGDRLVVYSDGLTEARAPQGDFLGDDGLKELVGRHSEESTSDLSAVILNDVLAYSDGVLRDDATILAVEPTGPVGKSHS